MWIEREGRVVEESLTTGELVYRGANVMLGYADCAADLALGDTQGGVLHTGDLGHRDAGGYFFVTGRSKRFAKISGLRINLDEIEEMVRAHGPAAVVEAGEDRLLICCEQGSAEDFSAWTQELAGRLHLYARVFQFRRVEALPLTANGKPDYPALKAQA
jgi:acyl-CoA synthetase (AMP-forming)/AMP-acid ligase II